ncbi:MAG: peptide chain release factor N(5)-glutamine methyltransferase [Candidatus Omnitrophota bacterium]
MKELETILCKLLRCDRGNLYLDQDSRPLTTYQLNRLSCILKKRISGHPLQYLTGQQDFMGLPFRVSPHVLIPRPETEILVQEVIECIGACFCCDDLRILDVGTGSGNIAIALAKFLKDVHVDAVDISDESLKVARANARLNRVESRVTFSSSDLFGCFNAQSDRFDVIVSNPPYICAHQYSSLPEDVRREPKGALIAQEDGLFFYGKIEKSARVFLKQGGMIFFEVGDDQALKVCEIFSNTSIWKSTRRVKDYCGVERVIIIEKV